MTDPTTDLNDFFDYIWSTTEGYVYLPVEYQGKWTSFMFKWPRQKPAVVRHVLKWASLTANVFYAPALFHSARPLKENVLGTWVLWVDFDGNAPETWEDNARKIPEPTLRVQSSIPKHEHCYWRLDEFLSDVSTIDDRNRALAYTLGADTSGWDADQILRPPHTINHKRGVPVTIKDWTDQ